MKKRTVALLLACMMMVGVAAGGTIAWLTAQSKTVVNTFTIGEVSIDLTETGITDKGDGTFGKDYKVSPGATITKDPEVTVLADSEACWLFVRVEESTNFAALRNADKLDYDIADGWNSVDGQDGYYYREVAASDANQDFQVLANDQVTVGNNIVNADIDGQDVTLTFSAAAIQKDGIADAAAAFAALPGAFKA